MFRRWFGKKKVKVEIVCPHGSFVPGAYTPGARTSKYSCDDCRFVVRLSTFRGDINW